MADVGRLRSSLSISVLLWIMNKPAERAVVNRMEAASLGFQSLELIICLLNRRTDLESAFLASCCFLTPIKRVCYGIAIEELKNLIAL